MSTTERQPLLTSWSPKLGSSLNPLAPTFSFQPGLPSSFSPRPANAAASTTATQPLSPPPSAPTPTPAPAVPAAPTATTSASITSNAAPTSSEQESQQQLHRTHTISPHTRSRLSSSSSTSSSTSSSSSFSLNSILPTRRAFRRAHLIQFAVSFVVCAGAGAALALWKNEIRWWELGIGAAAWLAGESLKEVVFELLTREAVDEQGAPIRGSGMGLPTVVHSVLQEGLRLGGIILVVVMLPEPISTDPLLARMGGMPPPPHGGPREPRRPLPPLDTLFFSTLWFALGWAFVEIIWVSLDCVGSRATDVLNTSSQ
jgi:hypothetical protein